MNQISAASQRNKLRQIKVHLCEKMRANGKCIKKLRRRERERETPNV